MKANASPYSKLTLISTGYTNLDKLLSGGIPTRKISEFSGSWSTGKSTLAYSVIVEAQKMKMPVVLADTEFSFSEKYAEAIGVGTYQLDLIQERTAEEVLDALENWIDTHKNGLVVLDSIGGLLPRAAAETTAEGKVIGGQAKLIATFCRKIVPQLAIRNIALLVINHEFTDLMSGKLMTSGGAKLAYHKSIWLRLKKMNKRVMSGETQVGDIIEAEIRKDKVWGNLKMSTEMTLIYKQGFLKGADFLQDALDKGVITKQGQSYFLGDEKICRGQAGLREWFAVAENADKIKGLIT